MEKINQCNLKNEGSKTEIKKGKTLIPPRDATLRKPTINDLKEDESRKEEKE